MDVLTTYKVFLVKTIKEKKYYWARNVFFLVFPLLFIIIYLFSDTASSAGSNQYQANHSSIRTYVSNNEVRIQSHPIFNVYF